jgi:hypothetical protein
MPAIAMRADEASDLAAFVLRAPVAAALPKTPPARLAPLTRPVRFDEVSRRVLRKTCWHCHSEPDLARGDGGPGNTGGFGFAPRGLILADYEGISSGIIDAEGTRRSVFTRDSDGRGDALLVRVLLARWEEEAGRSVPGVRGMPLALPPLDAEEIQLAETWVAQGARP